MILCRGPGLPYIPQQGRPGFITMPENNYELLVPFWIDTDGYSDRDREMFVCGVEYYMVYQDLKKPEQSTRPIHVENESRIRMLAAKMNRKVRLQRYCDEWTTLTVLEK